MPNIKAQFSKNIKKGKQLLNDSQFNKGTAFSQEERNKFGLNGLLPYQVEPLTQQVKRAYAQFQSYQDDKVQQNLFLHALHNDNQTLFYKLAATHVTEILPVIYTPTVAHAVRNYSHNLILQRNRGIYISYPERENIGTILDNVDVDTLDLIVATDGERVLGIGDQGVGAIHIPVAKLMLYSLFGGINPQRTLPIMLDVGTNNKELLNDPLYLGWRHERLAGEQYLEFIELFVRAVKKKFPGVFLHWEDFGKNNAAVILKRYREQICSFNDDIQGTAVVTLAALLAALKASKQDLANQRIVIFGAGSAGIGIANQIHDAMLRQGMSKQDAYQCFWLLDSQGLVTESYPTLTEQQKLYVRTNAEIKNWSLSASVNISLLDVVENVKPTVLLGCSAASNAFTQEIIQTMVHNCERPIIFPLSNPTEKSEAVPSDLVAWTEGKALIATGSPFAPVEYRGKKIVIAQCNNALAFPGIGLGVITEKLQYVSDDMLWEACKTLAQYAPILQDPTLPLLPSMEKASEVAQEIAQAFR
jgi:malate dehydrogenase (oxaloacetate-decarboxylating)